MKEKESKIVSVMLVRTEKNIRTMLKINENESLKEILAVLKTVLHYKKGGGRIIKDKFS